MPLGNFEDDRKRGFQEDLPELRRTVSMEAVLNALGIERTLRPSSGGFTCISPFPRYRAGNLVEETQNSFSVRIYENGDIWKDFGSPAVRDGSSWRHLSPDECKGDIFKFIRLYTGCSFREAVSKVRDIREGRVLGVPAWSVGPARYVPSEVRDAFTIKSTRRFPSDGVLPDEKGKGLVEYNAGRGISNALASRFLDIVEYCYTGDLERYGLGAEVYVSLGFRNIGGGYVLRDGATKKSTSSHISFITAEGSRPEAKFPFHCPEGDMVYEGLRFVKDGEMNGRVYVNQSSYWDNVPWDAFNSVQAGMDSLVSGNRLQDPLRISVISYGLAEKAGALFGAAMVAKSPKVRMFEGMYDYLSFVQKNGLDGCDSVVLNSTSNLKLALPLVCRWNCSEERRVSEIECCFDNDDAGRQCLEELRKAVGDKVKVTDRSREYSKYKDFNEAFLAERAKKAEKKVG